MMIASMDVDVLYIITAYYPDLDEWESDLKTKVCAVKGVNNAAIYTMQALAQSIS